MGPGWPFSRCLDAEAATSAFGQIHEAGGGGENVIRLHPPSGTPFRPQRARIRIERTEPDLKRADKQNLLEDSAEIRGVPLVKGKTVQYALDLVFLVDDM
ncbi:hypothetical protein JD844_013553 [Phrynosoma platyrhinos]|uniref:Uncharacterized protein n=1 Tax=Phrynosoma platyrhinos TaxID=52577 RepID=A0ABQ7TM62_PHRPL|nr:hypothetical protein JD844_013553 [Phrynosoma platyrhinos]